MSYGGAAVPIGDLGELLETAREDRGLTKRQAAQALGIQRASYYAWLRGAVPRTEHARDIARFVDLPVVDVLSMIHRMGGLLDQDEYLAVKKFDGGERR